MVNKDAIKGHIAHMQIYKPTSQKRSIMNHGIADPKKHPLQQIITKPSGIEN